MDYLDNAGHLYEFSVLAMARSDDYFIDCFDMSADGPGLVGTIRVGPNGAGRISLEVEVPVRLLRRWLAFAESEVGLEPT